MNKWGIICPGLSLSSYKTSKEVILADIDTLVAVNGAILSWFNFRYWVIQDQELFETIFHKWQGVNRCSATLWFPARWTMDIPRDFPNMNKFFNSFTLAPFICDQEADFNMTMPFAREINWREYTKFMAIALAVKNGAQQIHLFGDDMSGIGYYDKGLENCRTQHTERRWGDENIKTLQIIEACAQNGITIFRHTIPIKEEA